MVIKYIQYLIKNYLFALIALVFTIVYWVNLTALPDKSRTFPNVLLIILAPLFIWNFFNSVVEFRKTIKSEEPEKEKFNYTLNITKPKLVVVLVTLGYIIVMPKLGFVVCTALYLAVLTTYLGVRKPISIIAFILIDKRESIKET